MSHKPIAMVAGVAAVIALVVMFASICECPPRFDSELHRSIGQALARQVADVVPGGAKVTLITRDTTAFKQPALDLLVAGFKKELGRSRGTISDIKSLQVDPLRPLEAPSGDFFELIRKAAAGTVIVSLMGPPLLTPEQRSRLGPVNGKIVAFCPGSLAQTIDFRSLFEAHLLDAAVISRAPKTEGERNPHSFDQLYTTVTAASLAKPAGP